MAGKMAGSNITSWHYFPQLPAVFLRSSRGLPAVNLLKFIFPGNVAQCTWYPCKVDRT